MKYEDLTINQKINLRGFFDAIAKYAEKDIRSRIKDKYQIGETENLYQSVKLRSTVNTNDFSASIFIQYYDYGKFTHLGVGKGIKYGESTVARLLGGKGRRSKKWMKSIKNTELRAVELYVDKLGISIIDYLDGITPDQIVLKM